MSDSWNSSPFGLPIQAGSSGIHGSNQIASSSHAPSTSQLAVSPLRHGTKVSAKDVPKIRGVLFEFVKKLFGGKVSSCTGDMSDVYRLQVLQMSSASALKVIRSGMMNEEFRCYHLLLTAVIPQAYHIEVLAERTISQWRNGCIREGMVAGHVIALAEKASRTVHEKVILSSHEQSILDFMLLETGTYITKLKRGGDSFNGMILLATLDRSFSGNQAWPESIVASLGQTRNNARRSTTSEIAASPKSVTQTTAATLSEGSFSRSGLDTSEAPVSISMSYRGQDSNGEELERRLETEERLAAMEVQLEAAWAEIATQRERVTLLEGVVMRRTEPEQGRVLVDRCWKKSVGEGVGVGFPGVWDSYTIPSISSPSPSSVHDRYGSSSARFNQRQPSPSYDFGTFSRSVELGGFVYPETYHRENIAPSIYRPDQIQSSYRPTSRTQYYDGRLEHGLRLQQYPTTSEICVPRADRIRRWVIDVEGNEIEGTNREYDAWYLTGILPAKSSGHENATFAARQITSSGHHGQPRAVLTPSPPLKIQRLNMQRYDDQIASRTESAPHPPKIMVVPSTDSERSSPFTASSDDYSGRSAEGEEECYCGEGECTCCEKTVDGRSGAERFRGTESGGEGEEDI